MQLETRKQLVLETAKNKGFTGKARVIFCLDRSGSMDNLYNNGAMQELLERIVPVAMALDSNQSLEMFIFEDKAHKLPDVTEDNVHEYVTREIIYKHEAGGTKYAPAIEMITEGKSKGGFMERIFGKKEPTEIKEPALVIFITDGDSGDHSNSESAMKKASELPFFFAFVGIGHANFPFLERLDTMGGRKIDNASFFATSNLSSMSDEDLYNELLKEFPSWVVGAKGLGIL